MTVENATLKLKAEEGEVRPEGLSGRADMLSAVWNDEGFLGVLRDRLSINTDGEKTRRLRGTQEGSWVRYKDKDEIAQRIGIETVRDILPLLEDGTLHKEMRPKPRASNATILAACETRITWEESRLPRIKDAVDATELLEGYIGSAWKQTYSMLAKIYHRYVYADAVLFLTTDRIRKVIAISKEHKTSISALLQDDSREDYDFLGTVEDIRTPSQKEIKKAAEGSQRATRFAESFSEKAKKPVVYICNARGGTFFGYTVDTVDTQLARQLSDKEIDTFWREVRAKRDHRFNEDDWQNVAIFEIALGWMSQGKLGTLVIPVMDMKVPSTYGYRGNKDERRVSPIVRRALQKSAPVVFVDSSTKDRPRSSESFEEFVKNYKRTGGEYKHVHTKGVDEKVLDGLDPEQPVVISINPTEPGQRNFWDDNPHLLGERAKRFSDEYATLNALVLEQGKYVVLLAEKIEYTTKVFDAIKGENWFERNFVGFLSNDQEPLKKGTAEYIRRYREWVPIETTDKGKPLFDTKGLVIVKESATLADTEQTNYILGRREMRRALYD